MHAICRIAAETRRSLGARATAEIMPELLAKIGIMVRVRALEQPEFDFDAKQEQSNVVTINGDPVNLDAG